MIGASTDRNAENSSMLQEFVLCSNKAECLDSIALEDIDIKLLLLVCFDVDLRALFKDVLDFGFEC